MTDNGMEMIGHNDVAVNIESFVGPAVFETIQDDLKDRFVK